MAKTKPNQSEDTGAPAALKRLEKEELKSYEAKEALEKSLAELEEPPLNSEVYDAYRIQKANLQSDLLFAYKRWDISSKALREYDKSVAPEKREGEKILVSDAKEIFVQFDLSLNLAIENYILTICRAAARCDSEEAFHKAHASAIRSTKASAIDAAKKEGVLPAWLL